MAEPVTVVSGLPRSGTSLMMNLLRAAGIPILCDAKRRPDASNPNGYFELEAVKRTAQDASWLEAAPGHAVKVIHHFLADLPGQYAYRVILMRRPVHAVVASQNRMLERLGENAAGPDDGRLASILSAQWEESRRLLEARPHFDSIVIDYPALVHDPGPTLERLIDFLGLSLDGQALARHVDPHLEHETNASA